MSFVNATRQNKRKIFTMAFDSGNRTSKDLPSTGLLGSISIRVTGTMTVTNGTGGATLNANQYGKPFGLLDRIHLIANSGTELVNLTGVGLFIRNMMTDNHYLDVVASTLPEAQSSNPTYQFSGATAGANPVEFTLKIPVMINDRDPVGLILLQSREVLMTLGLDWGIVNNLYTFTGTATAVLTNGLATVTMEYFSVPLDQKDYPDLSVAHTLIEDSYDIAGTGDTTYTVPRGNIYQRIIHRVILNNVPAGYDDVSQFILQYNQSEQPYKIDAHDMYAIQRERYKRDLYKGVFAWDFTYQGQAGLGGNRDLVNSRAITDFLSLITIASGATLGTNNNKLYTVREQLVPLQ